MTQAESGYSPADYGNTISINPTSSPEVRRATQIAQCGIRHSRLLVEIKTCRDTSLRLTRCVIALKTLQRELEANSQDFELALRTLDTMRKINKHARWTIAKLNAPKSVQEPSDDAAAPSPSPEPDADYYSD